MSKGASADAETGSREPSPSSTGLGPSGFDPARKDADVQVHLDAIAADKLWDDEIEALINWAFGTVSRNPSDHEVAVAYRRALASVLYHTRNGWGWEYGSFMGRRGWMWRRPAGPKDIAQPQSRTHPND